MPTVGILTNRNTVDCGSNRTSDRKYEPDAVPNRHAAAGGNSVRFKDALRQEQCGHVDSHKARHATQEYDNPIEEERHVLRGAFWQAVASGSQISYPHNEQE